MEYKINQVNFSEREIAIISCICNGCSSKTIANILNIPPYTVDNHIKKIKWKMNCFSREAIIRSVESSEEYPRIQAKYVEIRKLSVCCEEISQREETQDTEKERNIKADLQNEYKSKEQITQSKINDTSEMISQTKRENQTRRAIIAGTVNEKITKTSSEISGETQDVSAKNEAIKQKVKERSKDGALWSAGRVLWSKDDDN